MIHSFSLGPTLNTVETAWVAGVGGAVAAEAQGLQRAVRLQGTREGARPLRGDLVDVQVQRRQHLVKTAAYVRGPDRITLSTH